MTIFIYDKLHGVTSAVSHFSELIGSLELLQLVCVISRCVSSRFQLYLVDSP
jgi:hypothetical protein